MSEERWTRLSFREDATAYSSASQKARVWSEAWVRDCLYCPHCGETSLAKQTNNKPASDFVCRRCDENYELKSQRGVFGRKITDGALRTMTERLAARNNPNLLLMNYDSTARSVTNLIVVPKHFFVQKIIEPRKPLAQTARRAGWQGCNIVIGDIPAAGKIWVIKDRVACTREHVVSAWQETLFLREASLAARGWLLETMKCVERIGKLEFTLSDLYAFEPILKQAYPDNANVRPKIRQQLQVLRDRGFLQFLGNGRYRVSRQRGIA